MNENPKKTGGVFGSRLKKIIIFLGIIFIFFLKAGLVLALEVRYPTILGYSINNTSSLAEFVCYFFGLGVNLAISISLIIIAYGGIYYLVSYGRGKFLTEGKEWIKAGILGLLLVVSATLIAYTINPDLTTCKPWIISFINTNPTNGGRTITSPGVYFANYQEIPIGTLTENLLTKTTDCYGFDQEGNPVDGDQVEIGNKEIALPTYLNHDRADCLTQLADGTQKKAQVIAELSDKIAELMNQCSCRIKDENGQETGVSKCDPVCDAANGGCGLPSTKKPFGTSSACTGSCVGPCVEGACQQPPGTTDCCPTGTKDKIEHGDIDMVVDISSASDSDEKCSTQTKLYKGLDEFRCPNPNNTFSPCSNISNFVEKQIQINNKTVTVIDQDKWGQLNLWQQLTYFKEKPEEIKQKIQADKNELNRARSALNTCYLATPYIDLLKTSQSTNKQERIISITPKTTKDGKKIDASKYCTGFNYENSSCSKKCNDLCPDTSPEAINLYKDANQCAKEDRGCLNEKIKNAYGLRPCTKISDDDAPENFEECISSCQNDCLNNCEKKYLPCSNEFSFCQNRCNDNSQCILDNTESCLFGSQGIQRCANQTTDQGNIDYCINNAYSCKNGSNEYAGYPDCLASSSTKCSSFTNQKKCEDSTECVWDGAKCSQNYSASFFYDNPNSQKCPDPYASPKKGDACYSKNNSNASCQELCPETTKCPTSSTCPDCSCDEIDQTLKFSIPNESTAENVGNGEYHTSEKPVLAHQMVGPQCNGYSYNDDPLTFYCEDSWWNDPASEKSGKTPMGTEKTCPKTKEIPVGQTVDDAMGWADALIKSTDKIKQDTQNMLTQMTVIGNAHKTYPIQDYCKCNAKLENNKPICKTNCQYDQWWVTVFDEYGDIMGGYLQCSCVEIPCKGSPCEQITDYISVLWNYNIKLKNDFIDFYTKIITEPRSDIMKELTYSRQSTSNCSLTNSSFGSQDRLLNCTRVEDELISPISVGEITFNNKTINAYCYGKELGKLFDIPLTDNWFCCQEIQKTSTSQGATAGQGAAAGQVEAPTWEDLEVNEGKWPW